MAAHRGRETMSPEITRLSELAKGDRKRRFTSIAHLLREELLYEAYQALNKEASAGVDGVTYRDYEGNARSNIRALHERLKTGRYRAQPLRRIRIPKEGGKERPISIPCLEDKIAQRGTVMLLNAIYEQTFLGCSYGFRPGRGPHDALDQVDRLVFRHRVRYILEADIQSYFDSIVRRQLMGMIEERIRDRSILRLIGKWINVGVIDRGQLLVTQTGTGQGQPISPLLANIYLHYVLDEWFEQVVKPRMRGEAYLVRYVDDFILLFQFRDDAERVRDVLPKRFGRYGLTLHPEKTRLIEFGRFALDHAIRRGERKPATFDFLGFTHVCGRSRNGRFAPQVRTLRKRLCRSLSEVRAWCRAHRHDPVWAQAHVLNQKLRGHYQYYGRSTNSPGLWKFYRGVERIWRYWLNRRTRGNTLPWKRYAPLRTRHPLLRPRITHPWPAG